MSKKTILIFCPWLKLDTPIGIFFIEQAEILIPEYMPILVVFKTEKASLFGLFKFTLERINISKTESGIPVFEMIIPKINIFNEFVNWQFEKYFLKRFFLYLKKRDINPSIIHAQTLFSDGIRAYYYHSKFNVPFVLSEHNQLSFRWKSDLETRLARKAVRDASLNLTISSDKIRQFASNNIFTDFKFIGNLISPNFCFKRNDFAKKSTLRLITVGAFTPIKDHLTMLKALSLVDAISDVNIDFVWIGYNGWGSDNTIKVNDLINAFKFNKVNITTIPSLNRLELALEFNRSDLFLFSSISEGMPVSVLEALACGLPVITTNCGGVDDVVNERNGRIISIKDFNLMAEIIISYAHGDLHFDNKQISEDILCKFGVSVFKKRLIEAYNSIL